MTVLDVASTLLRNEALVTPYLLWLSSLLVDAQLRWLHLSANTIVITTMHIVLSFGIWYPHHVIHICDSSCVVHSSASHGCRSFPLQMLSPQKHRLSAPASWYDVTSHPPTEDPVAILSIDAPQPSKEASVSITISGVCGNIFYPFQFSISEIHHCNSTLDSMLSLIVALND